MGVNKVEYGSNTLVDLTGDTVTPEALLRGITAHNAAGNQIVGTGSGGGGGSMEDTEDLIKKTVGWVGKNLFAISDDYSTTYYGVTRIIDREAGTVTLNGTATADNNFTLWFDADETHYTTKSYTLSELGLDLEKSYKIIVENASTNCYFTISDYRSSETYLEITSDDPVTFTFAELGVTSTTKLMNHIRIAQNATFNDAVIKVMITESQYTDEFEPNHPPATEYFPRSIVCETEAEWEAIPDSEKNDPNIYWFLPWKTEITGEIDDTTTAADKVWSSQKVNSENETTRDMITDIDWDATAQMTAGKWIRHNGLVYKVKVTCTGIEPPNETYYEPQTVGSALETLNSDVAYLGTPIVGSTGISGSANVSILTSKYIKYGRLVTMSVYGKMLGNVSSATNLTICELPYAPDETLFPLAGALPGIFALYRGSAILGVGANFCRLVAKSNGKYYLGQNFSSNLVTDDFMTFDFSYIAVK